MYNSRSSSRNLLIRISESCPRRSHNLFGFKYSFTFALLSRVVELLGSDSCGLLFSEGRFVRTWDESRIGAKVSALKIREPLRVRCSHQPLRGAPATPLHMHIMRLARAPPRRRAIINVLPMGRSLQSSSRRVLVSDSSYRDPRCFVFTTRLALQVGNKVLRGRDPGRPLACGTLREGTSPATARVRLEKAFGGF